MIMSKTNEKPKTKLVDIHLAALTRVDWSGTVEVPESFGEAELDEIVDSMYEEIDGTEFTDDNEYWEKGSCYHSQHVPVTEANFRIDADMQITRITALPCSHCPDDACGGVIEWSGDCSHCGRGYIEKKEETDEST